MSKMLNYVLSLIIVLLIGYIIYDKINDNIKNNNNESREYNPNGRDNSNTKYYSFSKDGEEVSLYLFEDNKFYYGEFDGENNVYFSIGKYSIDKNKLTLNTEIVAPGDGCYYTDRNKKVEYDYFDTTIVTNNNQRLTLYDADVFPIVDVELLDGIRNCTK